MEYHFNTSRRSFLHGGILLAGSLGAMTLLATACSDRPEAAAYRYWHQKTKGMLSDAQFVVMCGTLAPSAHNTQPWKFQVQDSTIRIFADKSRNVGSADPERRQMIMSIGCAAENMMIAAAQLGYTPRLVDLGTRQSFNQNGYCATLQLGVRGSPVQHPRFDAIFKRQTTRVAFNTKIGVPQTYIDALNAGNDFPGVKLSWFRGATTATLSDLTKESVRVFLSQPSRHRDGMKWFRITRKEWETKGDGLSIFTSDLPPYIKEWVQDVDTPDDLLGETFRQGEIDSIDRNGPATPLWGVIWAERSDHCLRLAAGRLVERAYLEAAAHGLAINPVDYAVEVPSLAAKFKTTLGIPFSAELLLPFRIGIGAFQEKSVRRPLVEVLV